MGKLPIKNPLSDITRENAKAVSGEEEEEEEEEKRTTSSVVIAAVARSSATYGTIADRDRRVLITHDDDDYDDNNNNNDDDDIAARRPAWPSRAPIAKIGIVPESVRSDHGRRDVVTRSRRNTWHAERNGEEETTAIDASADINLSESIIANVIDNNESSRTFDAPGASRGHCHARIADDDDCTCCVAIDVTSFDARTRVRRHTVDRRRRERRNWSPRVGDISTSRGKSIGASPIDIRRFERILDSSTKREEREDRFAIPIVGGIADISKCNECILSDSTVNNAISIIEIRDSIGIDCRINAERTWINDRDCRPRLIGIVESYDEKRRPSHVENSGDTLFTSKFLTKVNATTKTNVACWRLPRLGLRVLLLGLLAMSLFFDAALAMPSSSSSSSSSALVETENLEKLDIEELEIPRNELGDDELEIIRKSIVQGLGLQRIPDPSKANVSQAEYERAHREYLKQVQSQHGEQSRTRVQDLHVFQTSEHPGNRSGDEWNGGNHRHFLYFPVAIHASDVTVDHASLRFLLQGDHRRPRHLEALVYLRTPVSRRLLLRRTLHHREPTNSRWLELDSTEAAVGWLERDLENHGLELEFLHDGRSARRYVAYATLNVFTSSSSSSLLSSSSSSSSSIGRRKRSTPEELMPLHEVQRSKCKGDNNKKCCRHELTVMFKDLPGFEFIVAPKSFDAGYCKGRCPPRYHPAHHHALLQSLLWKENRKRVPKPCCAPSKLQELTILYFDENEVTKLQVSYWKNIQVLECACS
ncbi:uncharacterized protein LOC109855310 [Pseudomyrmex gracilis]|uniref:uncharacterized protein LOC109855310 n=1 Tax=Pseudomyrmex gracilis TaxID=219809 RepID=UPI000994ED1E|nr:uncharacterized protein LOC109855310 [Pseudomyrmex gracilis]